MKIMIILVSMSLDLFKIQLQIQLDFQIRITIFQIEKKMVFDIQTFYFFQIQILFTKIKNQSERKKQSMI